MSYWPPKTLKSILCSRTLHRRDWYHTWIHGYEDYNHCPFVLEHQTGKPNPTICMSLCLLRVKTLVSKWDLTVPDSLWWEWSVQTACAQSWGPTDCSEQDLGVHRTQAQEGRDPCGETNLRHTGLALLGDWQPNLWISLPLINILLTAYFKHVTFFSCVFYKLQTYVHFISESEYPEK